MLRVFIMLIVFIGAGLLLTAVGIYMIVEGYTGKAPDRSELIKVTGTVQNIAKIYDARTGGPFNRQFELTYQLKVAGDAPGTTLILSEERVKKPLYNQVYKNKAGVPLSDKEAKVLVAQGLDYVKGGTISTDMRIASLAGKPVTAFVSNLRDMSLIEERDIWELTVGKVKLIDISQSKKKYAESLAAKTSDGPYILGLGIIMAVVGALWLRYSRGRTIESW